MSYREQVAWLSLVAMAVTFGPYFTVVALTSGSGGVGLSTVRSLMLFGAAAAVQVLVLGVGRWLLRRRSALDASTPPDERDRAIDRRSVSAAYYVLMTGTIVVGVVMPFNAGGWEIVNAALLAVIAAEVVRDACAVTSYRLQS